jgi:hypothetical protein
MMVKSKLSSITTEVSSSTDHESGKHLLSGFIKLRIFQCEFANNSSTDQVFNGTLFDLMHFRKRG